MDAIATKTGSLEVQIFSNRIDLGKHAALYVSKKIKEVYALKDEVRIIFASAISQLEFLEALLKIDDIPWHAITAFHMDEYHTLPENAPQRFGSFLKDHLFKFRPFGKIHYMTNDLKDYANLISESSVDICCMGIGENGHLAFNDPPVADFYDKVIIKEVELDEICRQQQVNDGAFKNIEDVPKTAITLTIPTLLKAKVISVVVPGESKAEAISKTFFHPISTECPSTILRKHENSKLFLDHQSAKFIMEKI